MGHTLYVYFSNKSRKDNFFNKIIFHPFNMDKNKIKKEKKEEQIKLSKEDNNFVSSDKYNLPYISYIEKTIIGDGNCQSICKL